jgi:hypothetical protein
MGKPTCPRSFAGRNRPGDSKRPLGSLGRVAFETNCRVFRFHSPCYWNEHRRLWFPTLGPILHNFRSENIIVQCIYPDGLAPSMQRRKVVRAVNTENTRRNVLGARAGRAARARSSIKKRSGKLAGDELVARSSSPQVRGVSKCALHSTANRPIRSSNSAKAGSLFSITSLATSRAPRISLHSSISWKRKNR